MAEARSEPTKDPLPLWGPPSTWHHFCPRSGQAHYIPRIQPGSCFCPWPQEPTVHAVARREGVLLKAKSANGSHLTQKKSQCSDNHQKAVDPSAPLLPHAPHEIHSSHAGLLVVPLTHRPQAGALALPSALNTLPPESHTAPAATS